jgi:outer membrane protein assembly factor BamB
MSENVQLLNCPACGAPLKPPAGESSMVCPYCNNAVTINTADTRSKKGTASHAHAIPVPQTRHYSTMPAVEPEQRKGKAGAIIAAVLAILVIGVGAAVFFVTRSGGSLPGTVPPFEQQLLNFGTEGIGQGMLNDPRFIGVDGNGNIYAGDFNDGRINIFDPTGKFLRLIALGNKVPIDGLAVAPGGTLYLNYAGEIHRRDAQGNDTILTSDNSTGSRAFFDEISLGGDGKLYATDSTGDTIYQIGEDGSASPVIQKVFNSVTGKMEMEMLLAVDGAGDIYVLGRESSLVLKYSPDGKYIDQFGGAAPASNDTVTPGRFQTPQAIAVDGYGRIYVSDSEGVQVFDSNGQYLNSFSLDCTPHDMVFDLNNNLYIVSNTTKIIKLSIKQP